MQLCNLLMFSDALLVDMPYPGIWPLRIIISSLGVHDRERKRWRGVEDIPSVQGFLYFLGTWKMIPPSRWDYVTSSSPWLVNKKSSIKNLTIISLHDSSSPPLPSQRRQPCVEMVESKYKSSLISWIIMEGSHPENHSNLQQMLCEWEITCA